MMEVVVAEILQDKIYLDVSGQMAVPADDTPDAARVNDDTGPSLADL